MLLGAELSSFLMNKFPEIKENIPWIYLSSLAQNSLAYHDEIFSFLEKMQTYFF